MLVTGSVCLLFLTNSYCSHFLHSSSHFQLIFFCREYTAKAYTVLQSNLSKKAKELGGSCTAESVGKVLWIISIFAANGKEVNSSAGKSAKSESVKTESVKSDSAKLARDEEENVESDLPKRSKRRKTG